MFRLVLQRYLYNKDFFMYIYIYIYTKKIIHSLQIITAMSTESFPQITLTSYQSSF